MRKVRKTLAVFISLCFMMGVFGVVPAHAAPELHEAEVRLTRVGHGDVSGRHYSAPSVGGLSFGSGYIIDLSRILVITAVAAPDYRFVGWNINGERISTATTPGIGYTIGDANRSSILTVNANFGQFRQNDGTMTITPIFERIPLIFPTPHPQQVMVTVRMQVGTADPVITQVRAHNPNSTGVVIVNPDVPGANNGFLRWEESGNGGSITNSNQNSSVTINTNAPGTNLILTAVWNAVEAPAPLLAPTITVNQTTSRVEWAGITGANGYRVYVNGVAVSDLITSTHFYLNTLVPPLYVGSHQVHVRAFNTTTGAESPDSVAVNFNVHHPAATPGPVQLATPTITNTATIQYPTGQLAWTSTNTGAQYRIYVNGVPRTYGTSPVQINTLGPFNYGHNQVTVRATRSGNFTDSPHSLDVSVQNPPPDGTIVLTPPVLSRSAGPNDADTGSVTWTTPNLIGTVIRHDIYVNGSLVQPNASQPFSIDSLQGWFNVGVNHITVRAVGNNSSHFSSLRSNSIRVIIPEPVGAAPLDPPVISFTDTTRTVITWPQVAGAVSYRVYVNGAPSVLVVPPQARQVNISALVPYGINTGNNSVTVVAIGNHTNSLNSLHSNALDIGIPGAITLTSPTISRSNPSVNDSTGNITWLAVLGATEYHVYVNNNRVDGISFINSTTFSISQLEPWFNIGRNYITVRAVSTNASHITAPQRSNAVLVYRAGANPLARPENVRVGPAGTRLHWNAVPYAIGYRIYVDGTPVQVSNTTYIDLALLPLEPGNNQVTIVAVGAFGVRLDSPHSIALNIPVDRALLAPTGVILDETVSPPMVRWNRVAGATGYRIYVNGSIAYSVLPNDGNVTEFTLPATLLARNPGTYRIQVRAMRGTEQSPLSESVALYIPVPGRERLETPTINNPAVANGSLGWSSINTVARQYVVYINGQRSSISVTSPITAVTIAQINEVLGNIPGAYLLQIRAIPAPSTQGTHSSSHLSTLFTHVIEPAPVLAAPTGLSISSGANRRLTWNAVSNASAYYIYINGARAVSLGRISPTAQNGVKGIDISALPALPIGTHSIQVRAVGDNSFPANTLSPLSAAVSLTISGTVLNAPTNLSVAGTTLSWSHTGTAASGYRIYINGLRAGSVTAGTRSFNFANLNLGPGTHDMQVVALGDGVSTVTSEPSIFHRHIIAQPHTAESLRPTGLSIVNTILSWNRVAAASHYYVYVNGTRRSAAIPQPTTGNPSFNLNNLNPRLTAGTNYDIQVRAVVAGPPMLESHLSDTRVFRGPLPPLGTPWNVRITGNPHLEWNFDPHPDLEGFRIYVDGLAVTTVGATVRRFPIANLGLASGTYMIGVRALSRGGTHSDSYLSTFVQYVSATLPILNTPINLNINNHVLTWNAVPNATGYRIYVNGQPSTAGVIGGLSFDLSSLGLGAGTHLIQVRALGNSATHQDSAISAFATYVIGNISGQFTLRFDTAGGNMPTGVSATQIHNAGTILHSLPTPTRSGHTFGGWVWGNQAVGLPLVINSDITLRAVWNSGTTGNRVEGARQYVVVFDPGPGTFPAGEDGLRMGASGFVINSFTNTPTRPGYTFGGWQRGGTTVSLPITVTGDMTLSAIWNRIATPTPTPAGGVGQRPNPQTSAFGIMNLAAVLVLTGVSIIVIKKVAKRGDDVR